MIPLNRDCHILCSMYFFRTGTYPANIGSRHDRSAYSHWRSRCLRFVLADDNETLLYYNPSSSVNDQPKVVVKRGEVRRVIERIHDLIGHLGQKRTQIVVLKKLHWRSVRQDVKTFINSCPFCNQKKLEGKKILKAPVDLAFHCDRGFCNWSLRDEIHLLVRPSLVLRGSELLSDRRLMDAHQVRLTSSCLNDTYLLVLGLLSKVISWHKNDITISTNSLV
ncbi:unnamed protein product [Heligmosomoides polygyrus]|uniref:Integrase zinc-binding domain-containing protein n=1 Tax=Heligmosomoides polygyrus TaxID=6339 RepID=A0A3P8A1J5_HELPZ|nr:unnamed protein product [Heligmosomoides polygyrus]